MPKVIDLSGQRFERLLVVSRHFGKRFTQWNCICDCGKSTIVYSQNLLRGFSKSCGCLRVEVSIKNETTHGRSTTVEYRTWRKIKERCFSINNKSFAFYGGRGITMCSDWVNDFSKFYEHVGNRPSSMHSIDRIDNAKGYQPGNVRWATGEIQHNNTRANFVIEAHGERLTAAQWQRKTGILASTIIARINRGWSTERALSTIPKPNWRNKE